MTLYIGTKIIKAKPMNRKEYYDLRGWTVDPSEAKYDGYLVEYEGESNHPDFKGYISWSPKHVFESSYRQSGNLNFGQAIEFLKRGECVTRGDHQLILIKGVIYQLTPWVATQADMLAEDWQVV